MVWFVSATCYKRERYHGVVCFSYVLQEREMSWCGLFQLRATRERCHGVVCFSYVLQEGEISWCGLFQLRATRERDVMVWFVSATCYKREMSWCGLFQLRATGRRDVWGETGPVSSAGRRDGHSVPRLAQTGGTLREEM